MPILGLTERHTLPRLGKIRMGIKAPNADGKGEHPVATDYLVCPPEVQAVFGEKPRSLRIVIPVEDDEKWCSQYYRRYSQSRGKICQGDGQACDRLVDTDTGEIANHTSVNMEWRKERCLGRQCPDYTAKPKPQCSEKMNLMFMIPEVPGLGVWQLDSNSVNSMRNINNSARLIRLLYGRISMIPLVLSMEQREVINPDDQKKKKVWVLKLGAEDTLLDVASQMTEFAKKLPDAVSLAIPSPDDKDVETESEQAWGEMCESVDATRAPKVVEGTVTFKSAPKPTQAPKTKNKRPGVGEESQDVAHDPKMFGNINAEFWNIGFAKLTKGKNPIWSKEQIASWITEHGGKGDTFGAAVASLPKETAAILAEEMGERLSLSKGGA